MALVDRKSLALGIVLGVALSGVGMVVAFETYVEQVRVGGDPGFANDGRWVAIHHHRNAKPNQQHYCFLVPGAEETREKPEGPVLQF